VCSPVKLVVGLRVKKVPEADELFDAHQGGGRRAELVEECVSEGLRPSGPVTAGVSVGGGGLGDEEHAHGNLKKWKKE